MKGSKESGAEDKKGRDRRMNRQTNKQTGERADKPTDDTEIKPNQILMYLQSLKSNYLE